jgi:glycosyltransferase involved in cell wall biosynthesis
MTTVNRYVSPDVSLIISLYNQAIPFSALLKTIETQDDADSLELIICDDGSSFDQIKIAISAVSSSLLGRSTYVWQEDLGFRLSRSRNNGIRIARGRLLIFIDGDVLLPRNFIQHHVKSHTGKNTLVCGSRIHLFGDYGIGLLSSVQNGNSFDDTLQPPPKTAISTESHQKRALAGPTPWSAIAGCNFSVLNDSSISFDEDFVGWGCEDWELACRLWSQENYEIRCPDNLAVIHPETISIDDHRAVRPSSEHDIVELLANVIRLSRKYPHLDMSAALSCLDHFTVESGVWLRESHDSINRRSLLEKIVEANRWYDLRFKSNTK